MVDIVRFEAGLFQKCMQGDDDACQELAEGFWDRHYLASVLGEMEVSLWKHTRPNPIEPRMPERELGDPSPQPNISRVGLNEAVLGDLITATMFDGVRPSPVIEALSNPEARLAAARTTRDRLETVVEDIEDEIQALE
ncbi:hypothetical protein ACFQH6_18745 [Halobacteriaceae archaeon GCM10025711]